MDPEAFRHAAHRLADWVADYLANPSTYPVLAQVAPGDVIRQLPGEAPALGEPFDAIFADFEKILLPAVRTGTIPGSSPTSRSRGAGPGSSGSSSRPH
jgi:aromatic-L-amino-acid decarboxylase